MSIEGLVLSTKGIDSVLCTASSSDCGEGGVGGDLNVVQSANRDLAKFGEGLNGVLESTRFAVSVGGGNVKVRDAVVSAVWGHPK